MFADYIYSKYIAGGAPWNPAEVIRAAENIAEQAVLSAWREGERAKALDAPGASSDAR
jgi:hypothetical protein